MRHASRARKKASPLREARDNFKDDCVNAAGKGICKALKRREHYCGPGTVCKFYKNKNQYEAEKAKCVLRCKEIGYPYGAEYVRTMKNK
jgi:hypothetical protein